MTVVRCPACKSDQPHLHPAVQSEGEVELCTHDFHLTPTPQNRPQYIAEVLQKRQVLTAPPSYMGGSDRSLEH
jgi:hypothetical protein